MPLYSPIADFVLVDVARHTAAFDLTCVRLCGRHLCRLVPTCAGSSPADRLMIYRLLLL